MLCELKIWRQLFINFIQSLFTQLLENSKDYEIDFVFQKTY